MHSPEGQQRRGGLGFLSLPSTTRTVFRAHEGRHCRHRRRPTRLEAVQGGYPTSQWTQLLLATQRQLAGSSDGTLLLVALKMLEVRRFFRSVNPSCFRRSRAKALDA